VRLFTDGPGNGSTRSGGSRLQSGCRTICFVLACLLAGPVLAQEITSEPSAALRCLTPAAAQRGTPVYPELELARKTEGRVKVELAFASATGGPSVKVLESVGAEEVAYRFVDAVKDHVSSYRVPCLAAADGTARLVFDFSFKPDHRKVSWLEPVDADRAQRQEMVACIRHESGERGPSYPPSAMRANQQGRVLALMRFVAADQAPQVKVVGASNSNVLELTIEDWARGYRMPCHSGAPVDSRILFTFFLYGEAYGFKDTTMMQFLVSIKGIFDQRVAFDFNTMGCPFDVKLQYLQPHVPNEVGSVGSTHPARREFLEWLTRAELKLKQSAADSLFGDTVTLTIPCTKINLTPKE
jgi:hypothetical protein